jgi:predicted ATPase
MINSLEIKNIKCFIHQEFKFSNLTAFCGANSVGKSTAIQCLLLLRQTYKKDKFSSKEINLIGEYFSIGHVSDLINHNASDRIIFINIDGINFQSDVSTINRDSYSLHFDNIEQFEHPLFSGNFIYLSAERLGPRNSYDVNFDSKSIDLGIYGQFAMSEFVRNASGAAINKHLAQIYKPKEVLSQNKNDDSITLEVAVKEAMKHICPGFDIKYQSHTTVDKVSGTFASENTINPVRPTNTGFGVSYLLPIIIAGFCLTHGDTLIVENPEVHLHPSAQSSVAKFLAQVAASGVQVIIETHSDHVINGLRLFAKDTPSFADKIIINSIGKNLGKSEVKPIAIDTDGNLSGTQSGFFDQAEKDLLRLF